MIKLDSISKSRDITLLTKAHIIKAMIFLIVMYVTNTALSEPISAARFSVSNYPLLGPACLEF